jgi:hypothetical protein
MTELRAYEKGGRGGRGETESGKVGDGWGRGWSTATFPVEDAIAGLRKWRTGKAEGVGEERGKSLAWEFDWGNGREEERFCPFK